MHIIPYNLYNHFLVNVKFHVFNLESGFDLKFSFFEYVKSQMHFPLVVYLHDRDPLDYKEVYLSLTDTDYNIDKEVYYKVVRFFYRDISNSLVNIGANGDFSLDLECLAFLGLEFKELNGDLSEKLLQLNKASVSNDLILWR